MNPREYGHTCQPELYGPGTPISQHRLFIGDCPACAQLGGCCVMGIPSEAQPYQWCPEPAVAVTGGQAFCEAHTAALRAQGWQI